MSRAYSCRFMSGRGATRMETFTVPAGRRAVILSFGATGWAAGTGQAAQLKVHGLVIFSVNLVTGVTQFIQTRLTAYAGETISMIVVGTDTTYTCDGYLLEDQQLEPDDADNVIGPPGLLKELLPGVEPQEAA